MDTEQICVDRVATLRALKGLLQNPAHEEGEDTRGGPHKNEYVCLESVDMKTGGLKAGKGSSFSGRHQMSVLNDKCSATAPCTKGPSREFDVTKEIETKKKEDCLVETLAEGTGESPPNSSSSSVPPRLDAKTGGRLEPGDQSARAVTQPQVSRRGETNRRKTQSFEEDHSGGSYLSGGRESDDEGAEDDVSVGLSDDSDPCVKEDESHYITTHEIQLYELSDNEGGYGSSSSWDVEDDNRVYTFVDYGPLEGDGERRRGGGGRPSSGGAEATVSTLLEGDPCHPAKITGSVESASKTQEEQQCGGTSGGQIHLSIRTTSRAINDPGSIRDNQGTILYRARRSGDANRYVFGGVDGKAETLCDGDKCFIAAPGRIHFGARRRGTEVTGYSSGGSSAISEPDDADKEVRNLTAGAFKSLAYPYFDAVNFSTSSESSASERAGLGINGWSTFVDLQYGNMNMAQALDQSARASFGIVPNLDNTGSQGIALASTKPPTSEIFTLRGNPRGASSSTKKIELMGKLSQGGVITLTETLNFRCNVQSGMSERGERRTNFAQNAAGSRSMDEVTGSLQSGRSSRGASKPPPKAMEDAHKKAIFASSLIQNVISKKMQFEQERKMERGEIREPRQAPSPCSVQQEGDGHRGKGSRELRAQCSRISESGSDYAIMCVDELGDFVDSGSCDTQRDSRWRQDAPETNLVPADELGIDAKKGALDASKGTLLRSQNSAFRCWKDEELEFHKDHKKDKTREDTLPSVLDKEAEGDRCAADSGKPTKMSHLFVPSIQVLPGDAEADGGRGSPPRADGGGTKRRSDNTLRVTDSRSIATSKSPEIKINLRCVRDNKAEPFGVSKLRAASLARADEFKSQALPASLKGECPDKVPHFMVRDIRENKGKMQTPIHQVRDVRKLVKSSYHFVSLDNNEQKSHFASSESHAEPKQQATHRNTNSVSPIVIKCQSVNTNSNGKHSGNPDFSQSEALEIDRSSPEVAKGAPWQWAAGRGAVNTSSEEGRGLRIESLQLASKKQEKMSDVTVKKPESKMANKAALEKLQAAVKTMEQLYEFRKNEWKRRNEPQPLGDSHVLSLLAGEVHGGPEEEEAARGPIMDRTFGRDSCPNTNKMLFAVAAASPDLLRRDDKDPPKEPQTFSCHDDGLFAKTTQATGSQKIFSLSSSLRASTAAKVTQPDAGAPTTCGGKTFVPKSPKLPVSLKISRERLSRNEGRGESRQADVCSQDNGNYLTIPVKSQISAQKPSLYASTARSRPTTPLGDVVSSAWGLEDHTPAPQRSSIVMETCSPEIPSATIYHSLPLGTSPSQPQVYCFSPAITPAPPMDPFQATQRKMLLDPTTGNYYLVDTPLQPATKRLFDPEMGQYVDVPMPQPPMTPVHIPMSPLALSPGAYGHTYMIYPGFVPMATPSVFPARTPVHSQMSMQSEVEGGEKVSSQPTESVYMESPFYMTAGKSPQASAGGRPPQGFHHAKQPVISITSQQGPRIIAPPSFDGTTMSFVVEHR